MGELLRHHVTIFVSGEAAEHLEPQRQRWDPVMADQIAGHVTVVYPEEAADLDLLRARVAAAAQQIPPFPMTLGPVVAHESKPVRGVYHLVGDPVGLWAWLREFILAPPFAALDVVAHATITHPRTSRSGRKAFKELDGNDPACEFRVGELCLTAYDGERWVVTETFALGGADLAP